jgi:hypothetical protein
VRKTLLFRGFATMAFAIVALAAFIMGSPPASGIASTTTVTAPVRMAAHAVGPVTVNCGYVTCSAYLSRSATKEANSKLTIGGGGYAGAATLYCGAITAAFVPAGVACAAAAAVDGPWIAQEIQDAATQHGPKGACLKVTWTKPIGNIPPTITWWSTNNGRYCKD